MSPTRNSTRLVLPTGERNHRTFDSRQPGTPCRHARSEPGGHWAPEPGTTACPLPSLSRAKTCAHRSARSGTAIWAAPRQIHPIPDVSLTRSKTTRTEKARHQVAGCKRMAPSTSHKFSLLGKRVAGRAPSTASQPLAPVGGSLARAHCSAPRPTYLRGFAEPRAKVRPPPRGWPAGGSGPKRGGWSSRERGCRLRRRLRPQARPRPPPWPRPRSAPVEAGRRPVPFSPGAPLIRSGL